MYEGADDAADGTARTSWNPNGEVTSLKKSIDVIVTCAGRNGNLALNTGLMPNGQIELRQAERFREIGQWLKVYGQSIYGTRGGPSWRRDCLTTRKANIIYAHVLKTTINPLIGDFQLFEVKKSE